MSNATDTAENEEMRRRLELLERTTQRRLPDAIERPSPHEWSEILKRQQAEGALLRRVEALARGERERAALEADAPRKASVQKKIAAVDAMIARASLELASLEEQRSRLLVDLGRRPK